QRADALQFHGANDELILPARFINGDVALQEKLLSILQQLAMRHRHSPEQHAAQLRAGILEREINMARVLDAEVRHFTGDPDRSDVLFEQALEARGELRNG